MICKADFRFVNRKQKFQLGNYQIVDSKGVWRFGIEINAIYSMVFKFTNWEHKLGKNPEVFPKEKKKLKVLIAQSTLVRIISPAFLA